MPNALFHGDLVTSKRIIYTPSDFARTSLIHLQEIGKLQAEKPHMCKRENLSSFLFFIVSSGSGTLEYDRQVYELTAGDCVFIDCRKAYYHESSSDLWTLKWIHFYGPTVSNIYDKYVERGGQAVIHAESLDAYDEVWEHAYEIAASDDYIRDMKLSEQLTILLTQLMSESCNTYIQHGNGKKKDLLEIKEFLDEHYKDKISLEELSEHFYVNKYYLTRIFKEQFGMTITAYLTQIRITHAKQMLRFTNCSIEDIGEECGLGALYYFSRIFKKVEGVSPREYRKQWSR